MSSTFHVPRSTIWNLQEWGGPQGRDNHPVHAVVLAPPSRVIRPDHLPTEILDSSHMNMTTEEILRNHLSLKEMVAEFERDLILMALERNDWNQRRTARVLRTIPTTLNQKIKRLRIKAS